MYIVILLKAEHQHNNLRNTAKSTAKTSPTTIITYKLNQQQLQLQMPPTTDSVTAKKT